MQHPMQDQAMQHHAMQHPKPCSTTRCSTRSCSTKPCSTPSHAAPHAMQLAYPQALCAIVDGLGMRVGGRRLTCVL